MEELAETAATSAGFRSLRLVPPVRLRRHPFGDVAPPQGAFPERALPVLRRVLRQPLVDVAQSLDLEIIEGLRRLAHEGELASRGQDHDQVTGPLDVRQAVRDADNGLAR